MTDEGVPRASGDKPRRYVALGVLARVFPAPAGINRQEDADAAPGEGVPRASGDKPGKVSRSRSTSMCSPRQRG
ncbi:hypothetical protein IO783_002137 [Salmonella enterica subsp. enterica serovar Amager]|nr:hypothetical protein [Salmonella enterica subsp. enterica serovar Amager]